MAAQQKVLADPDQLAELRPIDRLQPGQWVRGDFEEPDGTPIQVWFKVRLVLSGENIVTGLKFTRVRGMGVDGEPCEVVAERGQGVRSLTVPQGRKCGLSIPEDGA